MKTARILSLNELHSGMVVWLQRSHVVEPHVVEIVSVKKGENYFDQKCMEINFSEPWSKCFTFLPPGQDYDDYGGTWVCWNKKPTKKEMEALEDWKDTMDGLTIAERIEKEKKKNGN